MSRKREREYERRRYERWQERRAAQQSRQRRRRIIAGGLVGVLVIGVAVAAAVTLTRGADSSTAAQRPTPTGSATAPDPSVAQARSWTGVISTSQGDVGIELDGAAAPQAVASFVTLAQAGFFDATPCHRLTTSGLYVLQCGDPTGTGSGGPGYTFGPVENAPADNVYPAGTIAMARSGGDGSSMGSQFFLVYADSTIPSDAAGGYTVFGRVTSGLDIVASVAAAGVTGGGPDGPPASAMVIEGVEIK